MLLEITLELEMWGGGSFADTLFVSAFVFYMNNNSLPLLLTDLLVQGTVWVLGFPS